MGVPMGDMDMEARISLITLGVSNLERSVAFYRDGLGLPTGGIVGREFEHGAVAFFPLSGGLKLALWAQADLAHDTGLDAAPVSPTGVALAHNVRERSEVDAVMASAQRAGASVVKPPQDTFYGGYAGYFQDPDGHLWEVAWNPAMLPE
ncbi:MAG: VOC family protein [Tabrizicola sp.]|jgi:catechol 2,3-dioxygenase-like lactoylglutathione lyase family enzyme|uniref:VOC family protein n=1 Tax=Tabrizicola sp. TaxID=2005166 RepID=UPI003BB005CF